VPINLQLLLGIDHFTGFAVCIDYIQWHDFDAPFRPVCLGSQAGRKEHTFPDHQLVNGLADMSCNRVLLIAVILPELWILCGSW